MFSFNFLLKCHRCQVILGWEKIEGFGKHGLYIKKKKKISAGKGPVSCCSSTFETNCSSQTPLDFQGQEQNLPDKRFPVIQDFLLEFNSEDNMDFPAGFSSPAKWDDTNETCPLLVQG